MAVVDEPYRPGCRARRVRERDAGEHLGVVHDQRAGQRTGAEPPAMRHAQDAVRHAGARRLDADVGGVAAAAAAGSPGRRRRTIGRSRSSSSPPATAAPCDDALGLGPGGPMRSAWSCSAAAPRSCARRPSPAARRGRRRPTRARRSRQRVDETGDVGDVRVADVAVLAGLEVDRADALAEVGEGDAARPRTKSFVGSRPHRRNCSADRRGWRPPRRAAGCARCASRGRCGSRRRRRCRAPRRPRRTRRCARAPRAWPGGCRRGRPR